MPAPRDKKAEIQQLADDLAGRIYGKDFDGLGAELQARLLREANLAWHDLQSGQTEFYLEDR